MSEQPLFYIDRESCEKKVELVYGEKALLFFYGSSFISRYFGHFFCYLISNFALVSRLYGFLQKRKSSRKKILPFIRKFQINSKEFLEPVENFVSFNDFFTRKLDPQARPIYPGNNIAIIPADARYHFFPSTEIIEGIKVKGEVFELTELLQDHVMAAHFHKGCMVIARLCPTDYHRFHFPINCVPGPAKLINGYHYSVSPYALTKNIHIFTQNKRVITILESQHFGKVAMIEVGATNVASIHQTYHPFTPVQKGDEKGYFSFGGSSLILLFEFGKIQFDHDLLQFSKQPLEIYCQMGQSMGKIALTSHQSRNFFQKPPQKPF